MTSVEAADGETAGHHDDVIVLQVLDGVLEISRVSIHADAPHVQVGRDEALRASYDPPGLT